MKTTQNLLIGLFAILLLGACEDKKKAEAELNQQLEQIESVEQSLDSTLNSVQEKSEEVKEIIKELDSI